MVVLCELLLAIADIELIAGYLIRDMTDYLIRDMTGYLIRDMTDYLIRDMTDYLTRDMKSTDGFLCYDEYE